MGRFTSNLQFDIAFSNAGFLEGPKFYVCLLEGLNDGVCSCRCGTTLLYGYLQTFWRDVIHRLYWTAFQVPSAFAENIDERLGKFDGLLISPVTHYSDFVFWTHGQNCGHSGLLFLRNNPICICLGKFRYSFIRVRQFFCRAFTSFFSFLCSPTRGSKFVISLLTCLLFLTTPFRSCGLLHFDSNSIFSVSVGVGEHLEQKQQGQRNEASDFKTPMVSSSSLNGIPARKSQSHIHNLIIAWVASLLLVWRIACYTAKVKRSSSRPTSSSRVQT
jgi:hypothetical protein